jgi:hypothetical protein
LAGGLLLGPAGALAGAAVSGGGKDTSLIVMTFNQGGISIDVLFDKASGSIGSAYSQLTALLKP